MYGEEILRGKRDRGKRVVSVDVPLYSIYVDMERSYTILYKVEYDFTLKD